MDHDVRWRTNWLLAVLGTAKENDARCELYKLIRWIGD